MVAESKIPESIKKYVPCKCCRIRKDGDTYRVYKYKSVKSSVTGKWTSDGGILIGKIIEDKGFIPNKRYLKEFAQVNTSGKIFWTGAGNSNLLLRFDYVRERIYICRSN